MDVAKVIEVTEKIRVDLLARGFHSRRIDPNFIAGNKTLLPHHLVFMCEETAELARQNRINKAMRWLGFIQGALWALGYRSVNQVKEANRPD